MENSYVHVADILSPFYTKQCNIRLEGTLCRILNRQVIFVVNKKRETSLAIFGKYIVNVHTCQRWFSKFRSGNLSLHVSDRSGRPSKIDNNVLRSMLENNQHLSSQEIAEDFGIHHTTVGDPITSRVCVKQKCLCLMN
ncbi:histone-lysine N-methyltransferase SETMAR [Trichonephila clavipes]|nr:histone-lysine N-methyltransferase SETMAR [Trichonephila clavipes]